MAEIIALQGEFALPDDIKTFCAAQAEAIRVLGKRVVTDIIEIGERLTAVKAAQPHGEWLKWLKAEFDWGHSTASKFMAVATAFKGKFPSDGNLDFSANALYLLAGPEVSEEIREKAIDLAQKGERITLAKAREMVANEVAEEIEEARRLVRESAEKKAAEAAAKATERLTQLTEKLADATAKTADLNVALSQLRASRDQDIATARSAIEARYANKLVVTEDELKEHVARLMEPSEKQIARLEGLLEREKERSAKVQKQLTELQEKLRKSTQSPVEPFDSDMSMKALRVRQAVQHMRAEMLLSAAEHIAIEIEFSTRMHKRPELAHDRLREMASIIHDDLLPWFTEFLRLYPGKNKP